MNFDLPVLTPEQYSLVYNMFSFTLATLLAAFVFFILSRSQVGKKYQGALVMSALVVGVAAYHYFRISQSWAEAYVFSNGVYEPSGAPFNDAYRYVDWVLTVPLLVAELVAVLALAKAKTLSLTFRLGLAAALMIILGYPGEVADTTAARALWGFIATIPFVYIVYVLWTELGRAVGQQTEEVRVLFRNTRWLLLATWGFYPIVYLLPILGIAGATALVAVQVGYSIADVAAKAGYGLMIYAIARAKTAADEAAVVAVPQAAVVPSGD
jgi:bacteriorhodopsin